MLRAARIVEISLFNGLRGRYQSSAASNVALPGAFWCFDATLPARLGYANSSEKQKINHFGKKFGCHTCGDPTQLQYDADHMPPRKVVKDLIKEWGVELLLVKKRYAPQCPSCSKIQGSAVRDNKKVMVPHHPKACLPPPSAPRKPSV